MRTNPVVSLTHPPSSNNFIVAYAGANLSITPPLDSMSTFTDEYARKPRDRSQRTNLKMQGQVPEVSDLPLRVVNRLFLSKMLLPSSEKKKKKKKKKKERRRRRLMETEE